MLLRMNGYLNFLGEGTVIIFTVGKSILWGKQAITPQSCNFSMAVQNLYENTEFADSCLKVFHASAEGVL